MWPTLPMYRVCYIASITDLDVWWDQNTFTQKKDVSFQNNENNNHSTQMMKDLLTNKNIHQKNHCYYGINVSS
jgi:hypothetical protein